MIDKIVEHCQEAYKDELQSNLTLANILCWLLFIISFHIFYEERQSIFLVGLAAVPLKSFFDFDTGVFSSITIFDLFVSFAFVFCIFWLSRKVTDGVFYLYSLVDDFEKHIIECTVKLSSVKRDDSIGMAFLGRDASEKLERNRRRYFKRLGAAQVALCFGFSSLVGIDFAWLNILVFVVGVVGFIVITWMSIGFYTSEVLPFYVAKKYVQGELAYFDSGVNE